MVNGKTTVFLSLRSFTSPQNEKEAMLYWPLCSTSRKTQTPVAHHLVLAKAEHTSQLLGWGRMPP
jgi:hypothetical protein